MPASKLKEPLRIRQNEPMVGQLKPYSIYYKYNKKTGQRRKPKYLIDGKTFRISETPEFYEDEISSQAPSKKNVQKNYIEAIIRDDKDGEKIMKNLAKKQNYSNKKDKKIPAINVSSLNDKFYNTLVLPTGIQKSNS